jgi:hypothetical protein
MLLWSQAFNYFQIYPCWHLLLHSGKPTCFSHPYQTLTWVSGSIFLPLLANSNSFYFFGAHIKIHLLHKAYQDCSKRQMNFKTFSMSWVRLELLQINCPPSVRLNTSHWAHACKEATIDSLFHTVYSILQLVCFQMFVNINAISLCWNPYKRSGF